MQRLILPNDSLMAVCVGAPVAFALGHGLVRRRVEEIGKLLNTVNQSGAGTRPRRVRIHRNDPNRRGQNTAIGQVVGQNCRALPVVAARGDHHHIWLRGLVPVTRFTRSRSVAPAGAAVISNGSFDEARRRLRGWVSAVA